MPKTEVTITEIAEFEPSRVDGVGKGAHGFPILMLKSIDAGVATVDDVTTSTATKADDASDRKDCETCSGEGTIRGGNVNCPDCQATGKAPKVGESMKQFLENVAKESEGVAASGSGATPATDCPTCAGYGKIDNGTKDSKSCPDCGGTGKDQATTNVEELNTVAGDPGRISVGDPEGREALDKAEAMTCSCGATVPGTAKFCPGCGEKITAEKGFDTNGFRPTAYSPDPDETVQCPKCGSMNDTDAAYCDQCGHQMVGDDDVIVDGKSLDGDDDSMDDDDDATKAKADPNVGGGRVRAKIADEDFAGKDRSFPIVTAGDVSDAAASIGRAGSDNFSADKIKANIIAIAKRKGANFVAALPQKWQDEMATKAVIDGATFTGMNPALSDDAAPMSADPLPGSPEWEAVDAATATQAAQALMTAAELIRTFAQREATEVAAGEGNDIYDAGAAATAMAGVSDALGIMAQLAFHESLEASKGLENGTAAKAGKRLSGKSVAALAAARDHLNIVLGSDDPSLAESDDDDDESGKSAASKKPMASADKALLSKEIENMSTDELEKVLDARDERIVELLAEAMKGESVDADAPKAKKAKKAAKAEAGADIVDADLESDDDAAKAEGDVADVEPDTSIVLTDEEIEAKKAAKEAKQALKAARKAEKDAAENAAVQKAIAEGVAEATEAVRTLQERLATVEKMAAPTTFVRTRPQEEMTKSVERDELEMRLARLERTARETPDTDIRKASREEAAEIRTKITSLSA